jgi:hypothetical protein
MLRGSGFVYSFIDTHANPNESERNERIRMNPNEMNACECKAPLDDAPGAREIGGAPAAERKTADGRKKSVPGSTLAYQLIREAQTCYCLSRPARVPIWSLHRNTLEGGSARSVLEIAAAKKKVAYRRPLLLENIR